MRTQSGPALAYLRQENTDLWHPEARAGVSRRAYLGAKVVIEWCGAAVLLLMMSPLMLFLAALVKLTSPGPAFYAQTRLGMRGRAYRMLKLRTMYHGAEAQTGPVWAAKDDPRITRLGRLLRDTHLDELPQLWNVLRGHMGLIGPRPERPEIAARLERQIPGYSGRLAVRPGVTGLAQMLLPADSDVEGVRVKLEHDLYYVRNATAFMDGRIAVCTAFYFLGALCKGACHLTVGGYAKDLRRGLGAVEEPSGEASHRPCESAIA